MYVYIYVYIYIYICMYSYIHVYGHSLVISGMCSHWFFCARCVCLWSTPPGTGQLLFLCGVHSIWDWPSSHQGPAVKQATLSASCMQATHIYICIYICPCSAASELVVSKDAGSSAHCDSHQRPAGNEDHLLHCGCLLSSSYDFCDSADH